MNSSSDFLINEMDKLANPKNWEKIICAANHYKDNKRHEHQPSNINLGFVITGHRHHNCIYTFSLIAKEMLPRERNLIQQSCVQGFLTTRNRFVSREEAMEIAIDTGQCKERSLSAKHIGLFSEDIY